MLGRLLHRIATSGPIPFDEFMEMCLYDPEEGYFTSGGVRSGVSGDFVTSPEVSPWFGRLIGRWAHRVSMDGWSVVEVGSGSGTLLSALVDTAPDLDPWVVERSPAAIRALTDLVPRAVAVDSIEDVHARSAVVVLNEVLDNVPAALVRRIGSGWKEIAVARDGDRLGLIDVSARPEVAAWADTHVPDLPDRGMASVQLAAGALVERIVSAFDSVALCIIDYAASAGELAERTPDEVVRTYREQRAGCDFLQEPGSTDVTVDVNVDAVVAVGEKVGAVVEVSTQRDFLMAHGADEDLRRLKDAELAAAQQGDLMGQLKARSDAVGLRALLAEPGLGSFRVVTMSV